MVDLGPIDLKGEWKDIQIWPQSGYFTVFVHDSPLGMGSSQPSFCEAIEKSGGTGR